MAVDGKVKIALELEDNLNTELSKAIDSAKNAGDKIEAQAKESNQLVRREAEKTRGELDRKFGKATRVKLVADADKHGIKNFDALLKELPKKKQTELLAKAQKGEVINYEKELRKVPAKIVSKVELNDKATVGLHGLKKETVGLQREATETGHRFRRLKDIMIGSFGGNLLFSGVQMAIGAVTSSVGDAIKRLDTLDNATRAYENMGIRANVAKEQNKELQKAIDGLPTSLQDATKNQQLLTSAMNNDLPGATKVYKAINDGILGFGGSAEQVNEAVLQLSQSFSNGKVDAQTWNSMLNANMGPTLNAIAKKMHMTTGELKDGLSKGKISVKDFQDQLVEMDKKGGGGLASLNKTAKDSTKGVGTALQNTQTKIVASVANIISGLQKAGLSNYINSFNKMLGNTGFKFEAFGVVIGKVLPPVIGTIKDFAKIGSAVFSGMMQPFMDIGKAIATIARNSIALKGTSNMLHDLAKNKDALKVLGTALGTVLTGILAFKAIKSVQTAILGVRSAFVLLKLSMMSNPFGLLLVAIVAIGTALFELYKHNKKLHDFVNGIGKAIGSFFKSAGKIIDKGIKSIQKEFKGIVNFFKKDWKEISLLIVNPFSGAFALLYKHNKKFRNGVNGLINWFKKNLFSFGKWLSKTWHNIWDPIVDFFEDIWNNIKKIASRAFNWISDHISSFGKSIRKIWRNTWNAIADFFSNIWNNIKSTGRKAWDWISNKMDNFGSNISKGWKSLWNGLKDFFGDVWNGIKKTASDGMNAVIGFINKGIGGINSVIHTFGGSEHAIHEVPKFAKGTKGAPSGLALVNDGNGEELIIDNQGKPHVLEGRNRLVAFSGGETVIPHEATKTLFGGTVPHFAKGTPNWFEGITEWVKDKWDSLKNFIKHPLKAVSGVMNNAIKAAIFHTPEFVKEFTPPVGHQFVKSIIKPITALFKKLNSKHEEEISAKDIGAGGNWRSQIEKAAKEAHVTLGSGDMQAIMARINKESGGRQNIKQQISDVNSANGNPAQGLLQYIPPTYRAWAVPGHTNILSGYDQLMAMFNDSNWASDIRMPGGWGPTGHRRFANGGWATQASLFAEVPGEPEVAINPRRPTADKLLLEAAQETAKNQPNSLMAKLMMQADSAKKSLQSGHNINQPLGVGSLPMQQHNGQQLNGDLVVEMNIDGKQIGHVVSPIVEALHDQKVTIETNAMGLGGTLNYGH